MVKWNKMRDGKGKFMRKLKLDKDTFKIIRFVRELIMQNKDGVNKNGEK